MRKWLRLGAALALSASGGWAVDWKARYPKPEGYVSDFARVIDAASRSRVEAYAAGVQQATGAEMALVTIPSLENEPIEDVANTIFRAWGVGQKGKNEGIMLLLSTGDHRSRLEVGYGLEPILPDGLAGDILREMRPALRRNDVGDAIIAAAGTIGSVIAKARNVELPAGLPARRTQPNVSDRIPLPMIVGGIFLLALLARAGGPRGFGGGGGIWGALPWLFLGNLMGGRSGSDGRGSGGFGGFDSGGGFGGFGGGDSGGGGASSDW
jgi:uncharacterized protein